MLLGGLFLVASAVSASDLILQKQREIDRLEAQADRNLLQQSQASSSKPAHKKKLAVVQEEPATPSPEAIVVLTDSDTSPPSQNRPKPVRSPSVMIDVGMQVSPVSASESPTSSAVSVSAWLGYWSAAAH